MSRESDFDKKFKNLSRKTNLNVYKQNMGFEAELKKLDDEINYIFKDKIKLFDTEKKSLSNYLNIGSNDEFIEKTRRKLDKL